MKIKNLIPWIARGLSIIITLGTFAFVFELSPQDFEWGNIFLAAIPGTILLVVTAIAWNFPKPGGLIFVLLGLLYAVLGWYRVSYLAIGILSGSLILTGLAFIFENKKSEKENLVKNVKLERTNESANLISPTSVVTPIVNEPLTTTTKPVEASPVLPGLETPKSPVMIPADSGTSNTTLPIVDNLQATKLPKLPEIEDTPDDVDMPAILPVKLPELKKQEESLPKEGLEDSFANLQITQTPTVPAISQKETIKTQTVDLEEETTKPPMPSINVFEDSTKKDDIGMAAFPPIEKKDSPVEAASEAIPHTVINTPLPPPLAENKNDVPELFETDTDSENSVPDEKADGPILKTDLNDVLPAVEPIIPNTTTKLPILPASDDQSTTVNNKSLPDWLISTPQNQTASQQDDSSKTDLLTKKTDINVDEPSIEGFEDSVLIPLENNTKPSNSLSKATNDSSHITIPNVTLTSGSKRLGTEEKPVANTIENLPTPPSQVANSSAPTSIPVAKNDTFMDWFKQEDLQQNDQTEE